MARRLLESAGGGAARSRTKDNKADKRTDDHLQMIVFSALQGTLLDENGSFGEAMPALNSLREHDIPLVLTSQKTRAEVEAFRTEMLNTHPFVVEFGGAVYIPKGYFSFKFKHTRVDGDYYVIELGDTWQKVKQLIKDIRAASTGMVLSLSEATAEEAEKYFHYEGSELTAAKARAYSDVLLVEGSEDEIDRVRRMTEEAGLGFSRRGQFLFIHPTSEAAAVDLLVNLFSRKYGNCLLTVGLGASDGHLDMLKTVQHPVLVQNHKGDYDKRVDLPYLSKAHSKGPAGWNEFISTALKSGNRVEEYFWFQENTFSATQFEDLRRLVERKRELGVTVSLALPALNEEGTVGKVIETLKKTLMEDYPLLDEIVLIDSNSTDRTREIAKSLGIPVYVHQNVLVEEGSHEGKGEALWKSLHVLKGDIIAWADTDVENMHPKFVFGTVGPLLEKPYLKFAKAYYRRPESSEGFTQGGGRTTELAARPLFNLLFPELSGIIQPLSGEYAGWREALESVPFFSGYGVETGLLIDIYRKYGLRAIAQVNLDERIHHSQDLQSLSKQAFAVTQVFLRRFIESQGKRTNLASHINYSMKMVKMFGDRLIMEETPIEEMERPPMASVRSYREEKKKSK